MIVFQFFLKSTLLTIVAVLLLIVLDLSAFKLLKVIITNIQCFAFLFNFVHIYNNINLIIKIMLYL